VAGHDRRRARAGIVEEVEDEAFWILGARRQRQTQPQQGVESAMLGLLDPCPAPQVRGVGQIRNHAVVPARQAEGLAGFRIHQPVAGAVIRVGAEAQRYLRALGFHPAVTHRLQRNEAESLRPEAETMSAALADGVFKIKLLPAALAFEQTHDGSRALGAIGRRPRMGFAAR
jgi:hypothetical protein